jgi:hypothetical protein
MRCECRSNGALALSLAYSYPTDRVGFKGAFMNDGAGLGWRKYESNIENENNTSKCLSICIVIYG